MWSEIIRPAQNWVKFISSTMVHLNFMTNSIDCLKIVLKLSNTTAGTIMFVYVQFFREIFPFSIKTKWVTWNRSDLATRTNISSEKWRRTGSHMFEERSQSVGINQISYRSAHQKCDTFHKYQQVFITPSTAATCVSHAIWFEWNSISVHDSLRNQKNYSFRFANHLCCVFSFASSIYVLA